MKRINEQQLHRLLQSIQSVTIAVYGDFCLDAYWILDPRGGEISVETGIQAEAVKYHYYSLGGAANVVANVAALNPAQIHAVGVIGDDIFGREMVRQLQTLSVDTRGMVIQSEQFDTMTYGKRYVGDQEKPRIDFGYLNKRAPATDMKIIEHLKQLLPQVDVLIFNQQVLNSLPNSVFFEQSNALFANHPEKIVLLDTRHYGARFSHISRKANAVEAAQLNNISAKPDDTFSDEQVLQFAEHLFQTDNKPVFITRGEHGIVIATNDGVEQIPGIRVSGPIDPVGAGDTVISALALALGAGFHPRYAAALANLAAAVTIQKRFQTGTANAEEILAVYHKTFE